MLLSVSPFLFLTIRLTGASLASVLVELLFRNLDPYVHFREKYRIYLSNIVFVLCELGGNLAVIILAELWFCLHPAATIYRR